MTQQQRNILRAAAANGGTITKREVADMSGSYFCNADKHLGAILSRMVKSGLLKRIRPGVFEIGSGKKSVSVTQETKEPTLFEL